MMESQKTETGILALALILAYSIIKCQNDLQFRREMIYFNYKSKSYAGDII